eukprot:6867021-Alexandrium_andersonii.AAC.1
MLLPGGRDARPLVRIAARSRRGPRAPFFAIPCVVGCERLGRGGVGWRDVCPARAARSRRCAHRSVGSRP